MARQTNIIPFDDARERPRRLPSASARRRSRSYTDEDLERAYATASSARERRRDASSSESPVGERRVSSGSRKREAESSRQQRQRARTKARADKMFERQFGSESQASSASAESAPRAALYEGKMGSTHRRSARMQRSSSAEFPSAKINPAGWFSEIAVSPRTLYLATAVLCVLLVGLFLYTPAQQYYKAQRDRDRLAAEYSLVQERNDALDAQNDELASDSGMEDAVRKKYGYVKNGEQTVIVTGLSEAAADSSRGSDQVEPAVLSSTVKAPQYWYTPLLDTFFGVE